MANVFIGSDYTITDVTQCNTASDTNVWYKVTFNKADDYTSSEVDDEGNPISYDNVDPLVYCTTINDEKFLITNNLFDNEKKLKLSLGKKRHV